MMRQNKHELDSKKHDSAIEVLRQRRGGLPKELLKHNQQQAKLRKQLVNELKKGPKTVPELAQATANPTHKVFRYLMSMRKYGEIAEGQDRDGYFEYSLKQEVEKAK